MFNGLFGKLFTGSKLSDDPREFILNKSDAFIWNNANMYLILPMMNPTLESHDISCINWRVIDEAATAVNLMRKIYSEEDKMNIPGILDFDQNDKDLIHLANKSCEAHVLRNMVVLAVHTGKIYTALHVADLSANSTFDGVSDKKETEFNTFTEYFENKYVCYCVYLCACSVIDMFNSVWLNIFHVQVWHSSPSSLTAITTAETHP